MEDKRLRFTEYQPHFDVSFWYELERQKLSEWRLDTPLVVLNASAPTPQHTVLTKSSHNASTVSLASDSFALPDGTMAPVHTNRVVIPVHFKNYNTDVDLKAQDRPAALLGALGAIVDGVRRGDLSAVSMAVGYACTFADLKTHVFQYATAFPVLDVPAKSTITIERREALSEAVYAAVCSRAPTTSQASIVRRGTGDAGEAVQLPFTRTNVKATIEETKGTLSLSMSDLGSDASYPSWAWRNVIAAARAWADVEALPLNHLELFCDRGDAAASLFFALTLDANEAVGAFGAITSDAPPPRVVGWTGSKLLRIDLGAMMDPTRLAESSARLNLGLMKWRMMPEIDLTRIRSQRVLLLGSGTLGCNIARHLMMWGVNDITLVDRGTVSFSNPVRQTLFELSDCTAPGEERVKSIAAAKTLKRILPTCNAKGVCLTIRMPGHAIDAAHEAAAKADVEQLEELICSHDVVYLLTDSRESRWLPSLLCAAHNKPVINAALGFDTYLVMRHGLASTAVAEDRVGCYFCNDVVAPMDSLTARTLDQQCTVTRPGVSAMASALAVELLAALCNHPSGFECPAYRAAEEEETGSSRAKTVIGIVPHQIRGSVSDYSSNVMYGQAYAKCTACSPVVTDLYKKEGFAFILRCLNNPKEMEEVTGLAEERRALAEKYGNWDEEGGDDMEWDD